jgi:hypothetical protein
MAVITIGIDPYVHLGPVTLARHGITIALGILIGALATTCSLHERDLRTEPMPRCRRRAAFHGGRGCDCPA